MMMSRAPATAAIPFRKVKALALCIAAIGVLACGVSFPTGEPGPVAGLLRRAQSEADARRFSQLLGILENKSTASIAAQKDYALTGKNNAVVKAKTEVLAAQVSQPPPATVSRMPSKKPFQTASVKTKERERKFGGQDVHVGAERAKTIWMRRGRDWIGLAGNRY